MSWVQGGGLLLARRAKESGRYRHSMKASQCLAVTHILNELVGALYVASNGGSVPLS